MFLSGFYSCFQTLYRLPLFFGYYNQEVGTDTEIRNKILSEGARQIAQVRAPKKIFVYVILYNLRYSFPQIVRRFQPIKHKTGFMCDNSSTFLTHHILGMLYTKQLVRWLTNESNPYHHEVFEITTVMKQLACPCIMLKWHLKMRMK